MLDKYKKLKEIIAKANSEILKGYSIVEIHRKSKDLEWAKVRKGRPFRLSDVLLAIDNRIIKLSFNKKYCHIEDLKNKEIINWNLKDNNLDNQSNECKEFLINLLVK